MQGIEEKHTTCAPITMEYVIVVACCVVYAMPVPCKMLNKLLCLGAEAWYMQVVQVGGTIQDLSK